MLLTSLPGLWFPLLRWCDDRGADDSAEYDAVGYNDKTGRYLYRHRQSKHVLILNGNGKEIDLDRAVELAALEALQL